MTCCTDNDIDILVLPVDGFDAGGRDALYGVCDEVNLTGNTLGSIRCRGVTKTRTLSSHSASRYPGPGVSLRHATLNSGMTARDEFRSDMRACLLSTYDDQLSTASWPDGAPSAP